MSYYPVNITGGKGAGLGGTELTAQFFMHKEVDWFDECDFEAAVLQLPGACIHVCDNLA